MEEASDKGIKDVDLRIVCVVVCVFFCMALDQAFAHDFGYGLGAVSDLEFAVDVLHFAFDGDFAPEFA